MNTNSAFLGYGYSADALEAAWQELERGQLEKGPDCPLTADLLDLALGLTEGQREADLHRHLQGCGYCDSRFQAQVRAAQANTHPSNQSAGPTLREQIVASFAERLHAVRVGTLVVELPLAADAGRMVLRQSARLAPRQGGKGADRLHLFLEWTPHEAATPSGTGTRSWSVLLWLPVQPNDPDQANRPADLSYFDRRQVRLTLTPADRSWVRVIQTQLNWDNTRRDAIVSNPVVVHLDNPEQIADMEFSPGEPVQQHDAS
jgi:hypothetical protein